MSPTSELRPVLTAVHVSQLPTADGFVEPAWPVAPQLILPLARWRGGDEPTGEVTLQALHGGGWISFLARWAEASPGGPWGPWVSNKLTVVWHDALLSKAPRDCATVCHTAYTVTRQNIDLVRSVSIPAGDEAPFDGDISSGSSALCG